MKHAVSAMPRPQRTKIIAAKPNFASNNTTHKHPAAAQAVATEQALNQISSDSDDLVRLATRPSRRRPSGTQHEADIVMSGALGPGDERNAHKEFDLNNPVWQRVRKSQREEDLALAQKRSPRASDLARVRRPLGERSTNSTAVRHSARAIKEASRIDAHVPGKTEAGRRLLASANDPPLVSDSQGLAPVTRDPAVGNTRRLENPLVRNRIRHLPAPESTQRVPNTPSLLANFRRRPRQGSLLIMVQQSVAKDPWQHPENDSANGPTADMQDVDLGDISPPSDDSVPSFMNSSGSDRPGSSRKRKSGEADRDQERSGRKQLRTTNGVEVLSNNVPEVLPDLRVEPPHDHVEASSAPRRRGTAISSSSHARPPPRKAQKKATSTSRMRPDKRASRAQPRYTLGPRHPSPDVSSLLSSLSSSPPPPQLIKTRKQKPTRSKSITTSDLKALLPRGLRGGTRNQISTRHGEFEILDAGSIPPAEDGDPHEENMDDEDIEDEDADELQRPARKGRFLTKSSAAKNAKQQRRGAKKTSNALPLQLSPKQGNARKSKTVNRKQVPRKVYAGRSEADEQHDKENDSDGSILELEYDVDDENGEHGKSKTKAEGELRDAAKKFQEVDEWDLEFESADIGGGGSSSPWR